MIYMPGFNKLFPVWKPFWIKFIETRLVQHFWQKVFSIFYDISYFLAEMIIVFNTLRNNFDRKLEPPQSFCKVKNFLSASLTGWPTISSSVSNNPSLYLTPIRISISFLTFDVMIWNPIKLHQIRQIQCATHLFVGIIPHISAPEFFKPLCRSSA